MKSKNKILCLGDACLDVLIPYGEARQNHDVNLDFQSGGTVANTASGLGRLDANCLFLGVAGNDAYGKRLKSDLEKDGVDCSRFYLKDELQTVTILIVLDENKDRFPFLMQKENPSHLEVYPNDLPDSLLDEIQYVHTSGLMLFENPAASSICSFLKKCHEKGIKISLDMNFRIETKEQNQKYLKEAISYTNYLFASAEDELVPFTGILDYKEAAMSLVSNERVVIARLGKNGADIFTKEQIYHQDAFSVEIKDTLGAGDTYNSGFLYAISEGFSLKDANKIACASAAYNIMNIGARNCPTRKELNQFLENH